MIKDSLVIPITHSSLKTFSKIYDPSKITIQRIFRNHWDEFLQDPEVQRRGLRDVVPVEVEKMMACGTLDSGFEIYECPNCRKNHIICYTCKSRFCNSCGTKYAKLRADSMDRISLNVPHRHIVFTMDERLRVYFQRDRALLSACFDAAKETLLYAFDHMNGKQKTFTPGFILTLHTFGRALNWNPHIHCLCTEGGLDDNQVYKRIHYINYELLRKSFMKQLLDRMKDFYQNDPDTLGKLKDLINTLYKEKTNGFYVNAPKMKQSTKGKEAVINYIIRYTGRPVMASSRIMEYSKEKKRIRYYYEDHKTEERIEVEESIFDFMKKLITHIPETQFKMIRYYGIYATCHHRHKSRVKEMLRNALSKKRSSEDHSYRKDLITCFNTDPLLCDCGHTMQFVDYWVPKNRRMKEYEDLC